MKLRSADVKFFWECTLNPHTTIQGKLYRQLESVRTSLLPIRPNLAFLYRLPYFIWEQQFSYFSLFQIFDFQRFYVFFPFISKAWILAYIATYSLLYFDWWQFNSYKCKFLNASTFFISMTAKGQTKPIE